MEIGLTCLLLSIIAAISQLFSIGTWVVLWNDPTRFNTKKVIIISFVCAVLAAICCVVQILLSGGSFLVWFTLIIVVFVALLDADRMTKGDK